MLYGKRFPLELKEAVYGSYVWSALQHGSEAWCLMESEMGILRRTERSISRAMCEVQRKERHRSTDFMFMFGLSKNHRSVGYGKQLSLVWSCVLERGWSFLVEVNLTTLTCLGYYHVLDIGVSLSPSDTRARKHLLRSQFD